MRFAHSFVKCYERYLKQLLANYKIGLQIEPSNSCFRSLQAQQQDDKIDNKNVIALFSLKYTLVLDM